MNEETAEKLVERLNKRIEEANTYFLTEIGASIKKIRNIRPSDAHKLVQILKYGGNYEKIVKQISKYTGLNIKELEKMFRVYAKNDLNFYKKFYKYRNVPFRSFDENIAIKKQTKLLTNLAKQEMYDFTRSNVIGYNIHDNKGNLIFQGLKDIYNKLLDTALLNVSEGKETFNSAMNRIMKDIGESGLQTIEYKSKKTRRLDSAVRMSLNSRLRELHNENQKIIGKEIKSDGVEITVHANPAPDHQYVQGKQFTNEEFEKLQTTGKATTYDNKKVNMHLKRKKDNSEIESYRPISEMNCYHYFFTIVLGVSDPEYTNKELNDIIKRNNKGFDFEDKHYTNYEGLQLQRRMETEIRKQKDIQILAKSSGDQDLAGEAQHKITILTRKYKELSDVSGLPTKLERISVNNYKKDKNLDKIYDSKIQEWKIGEFDISNYTDKIKSTNTDVIILPEKRDHIHKDKITQDHVKELPDIIKNPDHIYIDHDRKHKNTVWFTRKVNDKDVIKITIKINTPNTITNINKQLGYKNSVINMQGLGIKKIEKKLEKGILEEIFDKNKKK